MSKYRHLIVACFLMPLAACATVKESVNCDNAAKVRAAALATITAIDRYCPAQGN